MNPHAPPDLLTHLRLLWGLRLTIGLNAQGPRGRWLSALSFVASSAPAAVGAATLYAVMHHPVIAASDTWPRFVLNLLGFVTSATWAIWPLLSAGVDDHSELSRYAAFPISPFRLMLASTLASLFEPRALVFFGPLAGAAVGYAHVHPLTAAPLAVVLFVASALFNAALARLGLHVALSLLRQPRSAELIGGGFVAFLVAASFIPPIDTSWLTTIGGDVQAVPDALIAEAALALGRFPTGFFGHGLAALARGQVVVALADLAGLIELTVVTVVVAYGLLLDFHRHATRAGPGQSAAERSGNPFARTRSRFSTLVVKELLDLWHNPRARLLATVPFVLAILLKLLSARALVAYVLERSADAWLLGTLSLYGTVVIASTFSQNTFAYDGHGMTVFLAAPVELKDVLRAKNLVHASVGAALAVLVALFYRVYFGAGTALDLAVTLLAVSAMLPVLLTAGNFLSLVYPVKFHANLRRRDRLPFQASMLGVAAAGLASAPWARALRFRGGDGPGAETALLLLLSAALGWLVYRGSLPLVERLLTQRRELVLRAVTRD